MARKLLFAAIAGVVLVAIAFVALRALTPARRTGENGIVRGLKPGEGRDLVLTNCAPCHSTALVVSYRASRRGWDAIITQMQKEEGLWTFSAEDRNAILDYLEATQGPTDSAELAETSPWAQPLYRPNPIW
jgi:mono/diheme cytochrome c family protein